VILQLLASYLCWNNKQNKTKVLVQKIPLEENPNHWLLFSFNRIKGPEILELYKVEFLLYLQWLY